MKICVQCGGKVYPRQCRNSEAWRGFHGIGHDCPYGVLVNNLPIGDNLPEDRQASAAAQRQDFPGDETCEWLFIVPNTCCKRYWCAEGQNWRRTSPQDCLTCPKKKTNGR
jgi:hypothetical protein